MSGTALGVRVSPECAEAPRGFGRRRRRWQSNHLEEEPVLCCVRECPCATASKVAYGNNRFRYLAQEEESEEGSLPPTLIDSKIESAEPGTEDKKRCAIVSPHSIARRWNRHASHWTRSESRRSTRRARRTSEGGALSSPTAESARPHRPTLLGSFKSAVHQVLTRAMSKSRNGRISSFSWTAGRPPLWWAPTRSRLSRPRSRIRTASINGGRQRHPA